MSVRRDNYSERLVDKENQCPGRGVRISAEMRKMPAAGKKKRRQPRRS